MYIFPVYTVYVHFSTIYLLLPMQQEYKILKNVDFGMVHPQQLVVVLLDKQLSST